MIILSTTYPVAFNDFWGGLTIFVERGAIRFRILLVSRNNKALEELVTNLIEEGIEAFGIPANAADPVSITSAFNLINMQLLLSLEPRLI
jgi:hypothetical protein